MTEKITSSATIGKLAAALAKAQLSMLPARESEKADIPTKNGPARIQYGYATLADIIEAVRKPLAENGIAFVQRFSEWEAGRFTIETVLMHESGEWISSQFNMATATNDARVIGSAITYGCRYSLRAICGLAIIGEDDDGAAASEGVEKDTTPLCDNPSEANYLLMKATELFGDRANATLEALATKRFRIADGDWRLIPMNRLAYAIDALKKKADAV